MPGTNAGVRSEDTIFASELSYRRLFESAKDGILILEVDTGRITDVNPFLVNLLGISRSEMIDKTIGELSAFKDIVSNQAMLERLQEQGDVHYEDLPLKTRDGRHINVEIVSNAYQAGHKKVIQCNIRDITGRKLAENQIRRLNAELEQRVVECTAQFQATNNELKAFTYSVSHDLRAPIRQILGFADLLQQEAGSALSGESGLHLTTVIQVAHRMRDLIDGLLAFSRIGQAELHKSKVNLEELAQDVLGDFAMETKARTVAWELGPLPVVPADRALLRLALANLVSNAVKFTAMRAKARIEIGCVPGAETETVVFIRDNGVGFDPRYAGKLFGVFQRLHSPDKFAGTGIGLANVQRIIHRHGGRTWAVGAVDRGATFYFSIPQDKEGKLP
jgi:PAS domain S-box-containing protein